MKSSSGGTGFPACADRLAGAEARPTNFFMLYGWITVHEERLRKVLGGTGILPVRRTGWKPVPPIQPTNLMIIHN